MSTRVYREKLIDEVKRFPVLYDTRHEHHRDIDVRDRCWTEIATRLQANSEVLKREWKILRDSLRQSLKKTHGGATTKSGSPCKKWRFHARMAFLLPHMTKRNQRHTLRNDELKLDSEQVVSDPAGEVVGVEWTGGGESDALDLFFASVCASARRLPQTHQRALKRSVLDALLHCEAQAEADVASALSRPDEPQSSKPELYDEF